MLCGKPALDESLDEGLAKWAQDGIHQGKISRIIDYRLREDISRSSLKEFSRIAVRCLHSNPSRRPTMSEVVSCLNLALSFHETKASSTQIMIKKVLWSLLSLKEHFELRSLGRRTGSNDLLPGIESLQIVGDAFPGGELIVCGYSVNGADICMFQWAHRLPDGSNEYIPGATSPNYTVALDDLGTRLCVEVIPMDKKGRQGKLYKCFANSGWLISETAIVPVSGIVTEVEADQIEPLEGQDDNNGQLPSIESLQIAGDAYPGGKLQVWGFSVNGTASCMFQWFHHSPDGSTEYIKCAIGETYTVTLDDVGTYLGVEVVPMDRSGRKSICFKCFANNGRNQ